jgi:hypothetical protein
MRVELASSMHVELFHPSLMQNINNYIFIELSRKFLFMYRIRVRQVRDRTPREA